MPVTHSFLPSEVHRRAVLCIGGSDSSGLAGIAMDSRSCHAFGVHAATVITAVTAQNSDRVITVNPVDSEVLAQQIDAALALKPQVIKIGLLCNRQQVKVLVDKLAELTIPIIYDPVLSSSTGFHFVDEQTQQAIQDNLLPLCNCITPNLPEAEQLTGLLIDTDRARQRAAGLILAMGPRWVVIKGGHAGGNLAADYCSSRSLGFWLSHDKIAAENLRGSGCALASSLASAVARGYACRDALVLAKMAIQQGVQSGVAINGHRGSVVINDFPKGHWPRLTSDIEVASLHTEPFPACSLPDGDQQPLGLYPVVDSVQWLERLLPLGISTAQLRIKQLDSVQLGHEIERAVQLGKHYNCRLFINDYWQLAIEKGAYGVHLGQEDLESADLSAIRAAGLRLGLSSHSHYEVARALSCKPSYLACGPTFATTSKAMPWIPHGIAGLTYWQQSLDIPLVSIGGINAANIADVAATGVSGVAMISVITEAANPESELASLSAQLQAARGKVEAI